MSWLRRIAYTFDPVDIVNGVINNIYDGSGPSQDFPQGGWAYQQMQQMGPIPEVCESINYAAGVNPAARGKMQVLSEAAGCRWNPENPPQDENQAPQETPDMMPMIGQQEQPMNMPSAEFE